MGFELITFYIANVHIITVASLPTEPPRRTCHDHYLSLNAYNILPAVLLFFSE